MARRSSGRRAADRGGRVARTTRFQNTRWVPPRQRTSADRPNRPKICNFRYSAAMKYEVAATDASHTRHQAGAETDSRERSLTRADCCQLRHPDGVALSVSWASLSFPVAISCSPCAETTSATPLVRKIFIQTPTRN